jgi:hypothetical protein
MTESSENSESISSILNNRQYTDGTNDELTEYDQSDIEEMPILDKKRGKNKTYELFGSYESIDEANDILGKYLFKYLFILKLKHHVFRAAN